MKAIKPMNNKKVKHNGYIIFATKLQDNLISCEASLDTDASCVKITHKEIIYRTNNLDLALDAYIKAFDEGRTKYND